MAGRGAGGGGSPGWHAVARPLAAAVKSQGSSRRSFSPCVTTALTTNRAIIHRLTVNRVR